MLFRFLRQYFQDEEFEQNKIQLRENQSLLAEYKEFIQKEKGAVHEEKEKVDPDFLTLIWASIGLAFAILLQGMKTLVELKDKTTTYSFWIWVIITVFSVYYISSNSAFALDLTRDYALKKSNKGYLAYARGTIYGAAFLTVAVFVLGYLGK